MRFKALLVLFMFLSACTLPRTQTQTLQASLTLDHMTPYLITVGNVQKHNLAQPMPMEYGQIFPIAPQDVLVLYADRRLSPVGGQDTLEFIIQRADIAHTVKPSSKSYMRWVNLDKTEHYVITIQLMLRKTGPAWSIPPESVINYQNTLSIPEHFSLAQKEQKIFDFYENMVSEIDGEVTQALQAHLNVL